MPSLESCAAVKNAGVRLLVEEDNLEGGDKNSHEDDEADGDADAQVLLDLGLVLNEGLGILLARD